MPATISSKITPNEPCISSALLTGYILYISKNLKAENAIKTSNRLNSKRKRSGIDCPQASLDQGGVLERACRVDYFEEEF